MPIEETLVIILGTFSFMNFDSAESMRLNQQERGYNRWHAFVVTNSNGSVTKYELNERGQLKDRPPRSPRRVFQRPVPPPLRVAKLRPFQAHSVEINEELGNSIIDQTGGSESGGSWPNDDGDWAFDYQSGFFDYTTTE